MEGSRFCSAISWARRCFLTVIGKYVPPFTVASFATTTHSRPSTTPTPVTMPAAGAPPLYMSHAARGESSRNAVSGSTRRSTRSRAVSFPLERLLAAAARDLRRALAQFVDERLHPLPPTLEQLVPIDSRGEHRHRASVLPPPDAIVREGVEERHSAADNRMPVRHCWERLR